MTKPLRRGGSTPTMRVWADSITGPHPCPECGRDVSKGVLVKRSAPMVFDGDIHECPEESVHTPTQRVATAVDLTEYPTHYQTCPGPTAERTK